MSYEAYRYLKNERNIERKNLKFVSKFIGYGVFGVFLYKFIKKILNAKH